MSGELSLERKNSVELTVRGRKADDDKNEVEENQNEQNLQWDETYDYEEHLLYNTCERVKTKDFKSEVRGHMDVEQFVDEAQVLLGQDFSKPDELIGELLAKIDPPLGTELLNAAIQMLFVPGSVALMARTIQGMRKKKVKGNSSILDIEPDQTWLCAICDLAQLRRRHTIVATLKRPMEMTAEASKVRLFMLIMVPSATKATKNALEIGRTFGTIFADSSTRRKLVEAKQRSEFKSRLLVKANELGGNQLINNKNKSMIGAALINLTCLEGERQLQYCAKNQTISEKGKTHDTGSSFKLFQRHPRASNFLDLVTQNGCSESPSSRSKFDTFNEENPKMIPSNHVKVNCCSVLFRHLEFGHGLWQDTKRRLRYYPSDFVDAFIGPPKTPQKTLATTWFLYFGILLPTIAFSSLNTIETQGHMGDLRQAIIGQAIGGLGFALLGGQPLVIIMTTAPLCLYTKVIFQICRDYGFHFPAMYAAVGLWNGLFLIIYSLFGFSKLMKWCTRSTEEVFALFIVVAFLTDAKNELSKKCNSTQTPGLSVSSYATAASTLSTLYNQTGALRTNITGGSQLEDLIHGCRRETSILFVLLMFGTLWLSTALYRFNRTPYLSPAKRDLLADYALPIAVVSMSFLGSFIFSEIYVDKFPPVKKLDLLRAPIELLPLSGIMVSCGLGFTLSLLFFMDQNISAAMVNAPQNKLKKGCAYHLDLFVVGLLNVGLTLFGFPMMHGVLPHSPLHAKSLADIEDRVEEGHTHPVVINSRETRVTAIVAHILILLSLLFIPYPIAYIPTAVLNGLFLYMAVTSLDGLQIFERILLLFTEQSRYPPNHYIRRCPQRKIHQFTALQLVQLLVMCLFGFSPLNTVEMLFPVIILLMILFRHKVVPKIIDEKYLDSLDGKH